jgi:serine/threonine-protein kinase
MSKETRSLLRTRLRMASLLLALGFGAFFVRNLFCVDYYNLTQLSLLIVHGLVTVALLLVGGGMCHKCTYELSTLRIAELVIFGVPALYFVVMQWFQLHGLGRIAPGKPMYLEAPTGPWLLLIFVYALYVPNKWQRAAWVLGILAAAPAVLFSAAWLTMKHVSDAVPFFYISTILMMMALAAIAGTWGVYTINWLRREAFEARQLGQYRLRRLLGAGGMGEVYLAEHQLMKRPVAIKLIKPGKAADPQALARFQREVQATAKLTHWNSIEIFDYGHADDGTFYYVMEYLPGKSLAELVEKHGPMNPARVVSLLEQVCAALAEAHSLGLIHRDIKPGNIFAAERGGIYDVAKLLDFGLAKKMTATGDMNLTQDGSITGSPLFMAPEQATGDGEPDARSDIYALGAVAYYLLTGKPPFQGDNPVKILLAHAQQPVTPPSQLQPGIPRDLEAVVLKSLEKKPADRFSDAMAFASALFQCELHNRWTRADAQNWWQNNGGTDRSGSHLPDDPALSDSKRRTSPTANDPTHDSVTSPTSALVG